MFRYVPECSGMFRVPGFIDGLFYGDNRDCDDHEYKQVHKMKFSCSIAKN